MAGFARDVTTPIKVPNPSPVNLSQGASPVKNAADLLNFGLQVRDKNRAMKAEESRQATVSKGMEIAKGLESMQGQTSNERIFIEAQKRIRQSGGSLIEQDQLSSIVASQFGVKTLSAGIMSEGEKRSNDLEQEVGSLKEFGDLAIVEKFQGSTFTELSNDKKEVVIERARELMLSSTKAANDKKLAKSNLASGNIDTLGSWFKADEEQYRNLTGAFTSQYINLTNTAAKEGLEFVAEDVQSMKESLVTMLQNQQNVVKDTFSADVLLKLEASDDRTFVKGERDARVKKYQDQIDFLNSFEADKFKNYMDTATLLKDKDNLDLLQNSAEFVRIQNIYGDKAFDALLTERLATDVGFRNKLKSVQMSAFKGAGLNKSDRFSVAMGIMAGMGEGKTLLDFDKEDRAQVATQYWTTAEKLINTPAILDNSNPEGITSLAIASVQVMELAEEQGTVEDKKRALTLINSPQYKKLYDKSPPDIKEAMGRKVIQYNRDTLEDNVSKALQESRGSTLTYDATSGRFEVKFDIDITGKVGKTGGATGLLFEQKQKRAQVAALNKQLEIANIYGQDDPFISSLSEREARDFFIRTSGMPSSAITGTLSEFSPQQEEASRKGISPADLKERTDLSTRTSKAAGIFSEIETKVQNANLDPATINRAVQSVQDIIDGKEPDKAVNPKVDELSSLDDEEFDEFVKIDSSTQSLVDSLGDKAKKRFNSLSRDQKMAILSMSPNQIQATVSAMAP